MSKRRKNGSRLNNQKGKSKAASLSDHHNFLHLLILSAFAFAQPLYDILAAHAEFFAIRRSEPIDVVLLVAILSLFVPTILYLIELLSGVLGVTVRRAIHAIFTVGLLYLILYPTLKTVPIGSEQAAAVLCIVFSLILAWLYLKMPKVNQFVTFLIPAVIIFPLLFLMNSQIRKIILPASSVSAEASPTKTHIPIVMLVLDELSLTSLMNEKEEIDFVRFPHLASLAKESYWFRNATTVSDGTELAVPAILTGRYPANSKSLPIARDHPDNLFSLLGKNYDFNVIETVTSLCEKEQCTALRKHLPFPDRIETLLSDLSVIYLHLVIPAPYSSHLPSISQSWGNFVAPTVEYQEPDKTKIEKKWKGAAQDALSDDRPQLLRRFFRSISPQGRSALHYLHILFPHVPWRYLPSGKEYTPLHIDGLKKGENWNDDPWAVTRAYQRYLLQVQFFDRLIGELITHLKEQGVYDDALLIVTADHGVSFRAGDRRRALTGTNYPDLLSIPLFMKLPHQTIGVVNDDNVETIDIVPTIADVLGIDVPWAVDGSSLINPEVSLRPKKKAFSNTKKKTLSVLEYDASFPARNEALQYHLALVGDGKSKNPLYRLGPYRMLVGTEISELAPAGDAELKAEINEEDLLQDVDLNHFRLPVHVTGQLLLSESSDADFDLALALNGTIWGVGKTFRQTARVKRFSMMLPEQALQAGKNDLELYLLSEGEGRRPLFRRIDIGEQHKYSLIFDPQSKKGTITTTTGEILPIIPETLDGWLDTARVVGDVVEFGGWAFNREKRELAEQVVVFLDRESVFSGSTSIQRPGVEALYGANARYAGFLCQVPFAEFGESKKPKIRFFAISRDGKASELGYRNDYKWSVLNQPREKKQQNPRS